MNLSVDEGVIPLIPIAPRRRRLDEVEYRVSAVIGYACVAAGAFGLLKLVL